MSGCGQPRWYVAQTQAHAEAKACANLIRQGFQVYFPRYLRRRRHARRVDTVAAPLFPRYLFVAIDTSVQQWRCIHSTFGVARLICNGGGPAAVPEGIVEELQRRHDERGFVRLDLTSRFRPGDRVRLLEGAFAACVGIFESVTDKDRVAVLLDMLGRKVRIALDAEAIGAA